MESEMTSILVQGVGPEPENVLNSSKTAKRLEFTICTEFPVEKIMIFGKHKFLCSGPTPALKCLPFHFP